MSTDLPVVWFWDGRLFYLQGSNDRRAYTYIAGMICASRSEVMICEICSGRLPEIIIEALAFGDCSFLRNQGEVIQPCLPTHAVTEPRI